MPAVAPDAWIVRWIFPAHSPSLGDGDIHSLRDLRGGRLAAQFLDERAGRPDELVDRLDHVHGDADGPRLIRDRAGNGLTDPPGRVRRELISAAVLELVD